VPCAFSWPLCELNELTLNKSQGFTQILTIAFLPPALLYASDDLRRKAAAAQGIMNLEDPENISPSFFLVSFARFTFALQQPFSTIPRNSF
jgi:hypothetical protein